MLDFGYTPEALLNDMEMVGVDPKKIESLIVSHGHFDHYGGLLGFLDKHRSALPADVTLYAGGEDNFCRRSRARPDSFPNSVCSTGASLHPATSRPCWLRIPSSSDTPSPLGRSNAPATEQILANTQVEFAVKDGLGCNAGHYLPAELVGKIVPDEHIHEHATCFNVKDRGLVVISSCGHVGIVNSARQAQEVSGVQKIHALMGGFHLGPAPADYLNLVMAEIKSLDPDVIIPMHCSGDNFTRAVRAQMPDKLLEATTGSRVTFGA